MPEEKRNQENQERGRSNQTEKLNLNEASREELQARIEGVGESVAEDIVDYRDNNGGIQDYQALQHIEGIDDEMQGKIEEQTIL